MRWDSVEEGRQKHPHSGRGGFGPASWTGWRIGTHRSKHSGAPDSPNQTETKWVAFHPRNDEFPAGAAIEL